MPAPRERLLPDGGILLEYDALPSTQDAAKEVVRAGRMDVVGVRAGYQSVGRGRRGARWVAPPGACLLVTYILPGKVQDIRRVSFGAAVAVCEAIGQVTGLEAAVKWPNDVLLDGRKVAGCLIEHDVVAAGAPRSAMLIGVGLNANVRAFPPPLDQTATSLAVALGRDVDVEALEAALRPALLRATALEWPEVLRRWRARDMTVGRWYRTTLVAAEMDEAGESVDVEVEGTAIGVTDEGLLRLRLPDFTVVETVAATSAG